MDEVSFKKKIVLSIISITPTKRKAISMQYLQLNTRAVTFIKD